MAQDNQREMQRATAGLPTKSAKIRKLGSLGYSRQQIADFLGIRYQHVRNVLVDAERLARGDVEATALGLAEEAGPALARNTSLTRLTIESDGSVRLPDALRSAAGLSPGDVVLVEVAGPGELHLLSRQASVERARAIVRKYIPPGVDLVEELFKERRRQFEREERLARGE